MLALSKPHPTKFSVFVHFQRFCFLAFSKLNSDMILTSVSLLSISASLIPTQFLGPMPNGILAIGWWSARHSSLKPGMTIRQFGVCHSDWETLRSIDPEFDPSGFETTPLDHTKNIYCFLCCNPPSHETLCHLWTCVQFLKWYIFACWNLTEQLHIRSHPGF